MSSGGWTKLVPEIVSSSIWNESPETRCVWIAMIATKDKDGNLRGNAASLARLANVPLSAVQIALDKFSSPDPDSNNQEKEGRRIEAIPGGWHIVSHELYRARDFREMEAERKRLYRESLKNKGADTAKSPGHVPDMSGHVPDLTVSVDVSGISSGIPEGDSKGGAPAKPAKPVKRHYGEFQRVSLTDDEHAKLLEAYGDRLPVAIEVLDAYLEAKGRKYRSHYAVMKKHGWVWERVFQGKHDSASKPDAAPARDPEDMQVDRYRAMETYLLKAELRDAEETERLNREFYGDSEREMKWDYAKLVIRRARKALQERGEGAS